MGGSLLSLGVSSALPFLSRQEEVPMAQAMPPWIQVLQRRDPKFVDAYMAQREHIMSDGAIPAKYRSEEHTSELQSQSNLVCRLLLEKKKNNRTLRCILYAGGKPIHRRRHQRVAECTHRRRLHRPRAHMRIQSLRQPAASLCTTRGRP